MSGAPFAGQLDDWLRVKWRKDFRMEIGDPSWPRHDFRPILVGRLGQPSAPSADELEFPIFDLAEMFKDPIQAATYSSGPFINRYKPIVLGGGNYIELPQIDDVNLIYQIHDGALSSANLYLPLLYDNGPNPLFAEALVVTSVNTSTETITFSANHGMLANWRVLPTSAVAGLTPNQEYWVQAVPAANQIRLSATRGGGLLNLASSTTGQMYGFGYDVDRVNGTAQLAGSPAGRVYASLVSVDAADSRIPTLYSQAVFDRYGLAEDFKDQASFDALSSTWTSLAGMYIDTNRQSVAEVLSRLGKGTNSFCNFSLDALLQVGRIDLPAATAVRTLTASNIKSIRQIGSILPIDFSVTDVTWNPRNFRSGFPPTSSPEYLVPFDYLAKYAYAAPGVPIDTPQQGDVQQVPSFDLLFYASGGVNPAVNAEAEQERLAELYAKKLGLFEIETKLAALWRDDGLPAAIGDTFAITCARGQWKTWSSADPSSPDNTTTIDSTRAVVLGMDLDLSRDGPWKVKLTVMRQLPGYFPTDDLT